MTRLTGALATLLLTITPAFAAVDLTGLFRAEVSTPVAPGNSLPCSVDFTQTGGTLSADVTCSILPAVTLTGTVSTLTGVFSISGAIPVACPTLSITGLAAQNSYSFTGFLSCSGGILPLAGTITGSRCGNLQMDAGETCDDGNWTNGDCCSSTCQKAAVGTACTADTNACTTDACDAAGTCAHTNNTAPCDDGNQCTNGDVCGAGSCHGAFVASGGSCSDGDPCTPDDTCDGAGTCTPGGALDCGACAGCITNIGCSSLGYVATSCVGPVEPKAQLQMKNLPFTEKDKADWKIGNGGATLATDFGNPTAGTDYRLCMFSGNALTQSLLGIDIAAGSDWTATKTGFKYKNKTGAARRIVLKAGGNGKTKIIVKTKGPALTLPAMPIDLDLPVVVQLQAGNGKCWEARYTNAQINLASKFKSKTGSVSGAFVE